MYDTAYGTYMVEIVVARIFGVGVALCEYSYLQLVLLGLSDQTQALLAPYGDGGDGTGKEEIVAQGEYRHDALVLGVDESIDISSVLCYERYGRISFHIWSESRVYLLDFYVN